jgi:hypothetical protein
MHARGRPVLAGFAGLFFGLSLSLALLVFGVVALESKVLVAVPIVMIILGVAWAFWAPLGGRTPPPPRPGTVPAQPPH